MNVNTNNLVSITEANQNFSRVARMVDESDEDVLAVSKRLIAKNRKAYEVIAE